MANTTDFYTNPSRQIFLPQADSTFSISASSNHPDYIGMNNDDIYLLDRDRGSSTSPPYIYRYDYDGTQENAGTSLLFSLGSFATSDIQVRGFYVSETRVFFTLWEMSNGDYIKFKSLEINDDGTIGDEVESESVDLDISDLPDIENIDYPAGDIVVTDTRIGMCIEDDDGVKVAFWDRSGARQSQDDWLTEQDSEYSITLSFDESVLYMSISNEGRILAYTIAGTRIPSKDVSMRSVYTSSMETNNHDTDIVLSACVNPHNSGVVTLIHDRSISDSPKVRFSPYLTDYSLTDGTDEKIDVDASEIVLFVRFDDPKEFDYVYVDAENADDIEIEKPGLIGVESSVRESDLAFTWNAHDDETITSSGIVAISDADGKSFRIVINRDSSSSNLVLKRIVLCKHLMRFPDGIFSEINPSSIHRTRGHHNFISGRRRKYKGLGVPKQGIRLGAENLLYDTSLWSPTVGDDNYNSLMQEYGDIDADLRGDVKKLKELFEQHESFMFADSIEAYPERIYVATFNEDVCEFPYSDFWKEQGNNITVEVEES